MSCNRPLLAEKGDLLPSGKYKYIPVGRYSPVLLKTHPDAIMIPCGRCDGCRADYTRTWADRMILELDHSGKGVFLTLTYDDEHLPVVYQTTTGECTPTLSKRDVQLFMKRLRKCFKGREIRYYICGEYGPSTGRPHYHAIIYGLGCADFDDLAPHGINPLGQQYFVSEFLKAEIWKNGFCLLSDVSYRTCAYVARYVRKKLFEKDEMSFESRLKEPVFSLMSRSPGIGMYYPIEHPDVYEKGKMYFSDHNGSVQVYLPAAFLRQLEKLDPDKYQQLKEQRRSAAENTLLSRLIQTDVEFDELCSRENQKITDSGRYIDSLQFV